MKSILLTVGAIFAVTTMFILSLSPSASADDYGKGNAQGWDDKTTESMPMGKHSMGTTIESIDHKTGFMKLKSGMGEMTIHFPAPAVKDLNKGDKITVNLSYTREGEKMKDDGMMKMK
jgi:hypothetical protein